MGSEFRFGRRVNLSDGYDVNNYWMRDEVQIVKFTKAAVNGSGCGFLADEGLGSIPLSRSLGK
jgi:hypothetical protein